MKMLKPTVAGTATARPMAVATRASEMPGATVAREADLSMPMEWKELMIPQTVPNRPMKGAVLAVVARMERERSSRASSLATPCRRDRRTLSTTTSLVLPISLERLNSSTP